MGVNNTVTTANANATLLFPCRPNTTYSWWHTAGTGGCRAFELPTDTVTQGQEAYWAVGNPAYNDAMTVRKYTTSANAKLLCVLFGRDATNVGRTFEAQLADFMLVEGDITTATSYEPYKFGWHTVGTPEVLTVGEHTASVENLLAIGDYKDTQEIIHGIKTGKVGVKVLDGTEDWQKQSGSYRYYIDISDASTDNAYIPICTHFKGVSGSTAWSNVNNGEFKHASGVNTFYFQNDACTTKNEFTVFLAAEYSAGHPVIVFYPLATETTESITPQITDRTYPQTISYTAEISDIVITPTYSEHTVPIPECPLDILCNNGRLESQKQSGLPNRYTLVDGITNDTGTYFDTGILDDVDDVEFEIKVKPSSGSWYIFQSRPSTTSGAMYGITGGSAGAKIELSVGTVASVVSGTTRDTSHVYTVRASHKNGVATIYVKDETTGNEDT